MDLNDVHPILESAKYVADNSQYVHIDLEKVKDAAKKMYQVMSDGGFDLSKWKEHSLNPKEMNEDTVHWIFLVDTLNFSFWHEENEEKYVCKWKGKEYTGYWSLCAAINRAIEEGYPILSAEFMANISQETMEHIFRSETKTKIPMIKERMAAMREAGEVLNDRFGGKFTELIKIADGSCSSLLSLVVSSFSSYQDVAFFLGREVKFYKRAQILIADLWACFEGKSYGRFQDIDKITMFADYRVPQMLVALGVLKYSSTLMERIKEEIPSGDPFEVEIRGNSIWSVELIKREIEKCIEEKGEKRGIMNSIVLDFYLWDTAKEQQDSLSDIPIHKTRSVFY